MTNSMYSLKCPSCGSPLNTPNNHGVSECSYCGIKIVVPETRKTKAGGNLIHFQELCEVAKQTLNYKDLLKYSNKILEIDSNESKGWIYKAIATAHLSTDKNDRFFEAHGYLQQASRLSLNLNFISETSEEIKQFQLDLYRHLAVENSYKAADHLRSLSGKGSYYQYKVINYCLNILNIEPGDIRTLEMLRLTEEAGRMTKLKMPDEVYMRLRTLENIKAKQSAISRLPQLQANLKNYQDRLAKLKQKKGFFARRDLANIQAEINKITKEIEQLKQLINP